MALKRSEKQLETQTSLRAREATASLLKRAWKSRVHQSPVESGVRRVVENQESQASQTRWKIRATSLKAIPSPRLWTVAHLSRG